MATPNKAPQPHIQEVYASTSNTSAVNEERLQTSNGADTVELQPVGAATAPASQVANDRKQATTVVASSYSSSNNVAASDDSNHHPNQHDGTTDTTLPRWYNSSSNQSANRVQTLLTKTKLLTVWNWLCGPSPPRTITFKPFFPRWQSLPSRYISKWLGKPRGEYIFATACFVLWLIIFSVLLNTSARGSIAPISDQRPLRLSCISELWDNAPTCGIDGKNCEPFDGQPFAFLCPSNCLSAEVLEPYTVGDQEVIYRPLVIGGPNASESGIPVYRGDSFICGAAIHAGVITNARGGCGLLTRQGQQKNFPSVESNGILSVGFPSSFPLTFSISPIDANCVDPQWSSFAVSVLFTALISLVITSPKIFTATVLIITFFQIGLISSAPNYYDFSEVISTAFSRFLPALFVMIVVYQYCIRRALRGVHAPLERTILWLGGCWIGAMNDYTFDKIPIQRLTSHDLSQQPGAIVALIVIVLVIATVAIGQFWFYRLEGRLTKYLAFYIGIGIIVGCLTSIPTLEFRLHHYILALLLLPGTSLQTRPSFLYQGLLVGLFINGIARWGFASILQTPAALLGEGQTGSPLPTLDNVLHTFLPNVTDTVTFNITSIAEGFDGLSILVNDVERYQESRLQVPSSFNWTKADETETTFFRFAYTSTYTLGGVAVGDYTKASVWFGNGTWLDMGDGPS